MKAIRQTHRLLLSTRIRSIRFSSSIAMPAVHVDAASRGGIPHSVAAVGGSHSDAAATVLPKQQPTTSADGKKSGFNSYQSWGGLERDAEEEMVRRAVASVASA